MGQTSAETRAAMPAATRVRTLDDLAGPRGMPFVGNLPRLRRDGAFHKVLADWADRYGPTYRIKLGPAPTVVTSDPQVISVVLRDRPGRFRRVTRVSQIMEELIGTGLFTAEGERWRRLRRMTGQSMNAAYLRQYFATITRTTERLCNRWTALADSEARVDARDDLSRYTLDVTVGLALGYDLNCLENRGDGLHNRLLPLFPELARRLGAAVPYWRWLELPRDRRITAVVAELEEIVRGQVAAARQRMISGATPTNFLENLVTPVPGEEPFSHQEIFANVLTIMVAGQDTTASAAAWAVYLLARHPHEQQRVREEADRVLGDRPFATEPAQARRLRYAEAVVQEALRMYPVAPFLGVEPLEDVELTCADGVLRVRRGTPILVLINDGSRRDAGRFSEPDAFRPQRWLDEDPPPGGTGTEPDAGAGAGAGAPYPDPLPYPDPFMPFGNGPRFCPGRNLAMTEATLVASTVCRNVQVRPDTTTGSPTDRFAFTVVPDNLFVRLAPRTSR